MKPLVSTLLAIFLLLAAVAPVPVAAAPAAVTIPTFSIVSVVADKTVTIKTKNFPANDSFNVLMGFIGTRGVNGIKVTNISSGAGGSFTATFDIPAALQGQFQIAIRLQSSTGSGFFAFNWFFNKVGGTNIGGGTVPGGTIPTFTILSVVADKTVTIQTRNFPANDTFNVLMGKMGTAGINGIKVTSISSNAGGVFTATFNIPASLQGLQRIAIRLQSPTSGFFAFNWFFNRTAGTSTGGGTVPSTFVIPTFSIASVVRDSTVTITTKNFPANDNFNVLMGKMGTRGVNGVLVKSVSSGAGGTLSFTFDIPASLKGNFQIAIRLESPTSGFFAYNWFFNTTAK